MSNKKKKQNKKSETTATKTFEILRIDWKDHWTGNKNWAPANEITDGPINCVTVGIKIKEDKEGVTLALNACSNLLFADTMYILKNCIIKTTNLGTVEYGQAN